MTAYPTSRFPYGTELLTERLILKTSYLALAPLACAYMARNRAFFEPWGPLVGDEFYTPEAQLEKLRREQSWMDDDRMMRFWLFKGDDHQRAHVIGDLAFSNIVRGSFQSCHLGYKLDQAENGQGYMTEALTCAIRFAFEELHLHRIEANIIPRNLPSIRLVQRLGFVDEGLSRKYLKIQGVWEDHRHFALLNSEDV